MSIWSYRQAQPADAPLFAEWVNSNPLIDPDDVQRTIHGNNPTCVFLVAECDGEPLSFVPVYIPIHIAHVAFSPKARASQKLKALAGLKDYITAFAVQLGIREITTLSQSDYPIAKWALNNGFEKDTRELFRCDLNKLLPARQDPAK
jgi:hypothetical protein